MTDREAKETWDRFYNLTGGALIFALLVFEATTLLTGASIIYLIICSITAITPSYDDKSRGK